jgi:response regulator RpfG family c-di-GMP phosphodiesterase
VIDLPATDDRTKEDPRALNAPVNILLVDDEPRNLDVLESILQAADYRLVRAQTAESALLLLLDTEFSAIVLDIHMPEISGIELANLIKQRKRTQHIPIIFLTAYFQDEKDVLQGYGSGAVDYLTKPVNQAILKSKVAVFVELFRKTRALASTNAALEAEIVQRQAAEEALQRANNELEARVLARTADLNRANDELREREAALKASEAQAMAGSRAKDDFLAALSHELRTPLNPVLLLATESAADPGLHLTPSSRLWTLFMMPTTTGHTGRHAFWLSA